MGSSWTLPYPFTVFTHQISKFLFIPFYFLYSKTDLLIYFLHLTRSFNPLIWKTTHFIFYF
jgi:hypothetical protein